MSPQLNILDKLQSRGLILLISACSIGIGVLGIYFVYRDLETLPTSITSSGVETYTPDSTEINNSTIYVYVSGAVVKPGVYKMLNDSRTYEVLKMAGGISSGADSSYLLKNLNLAAKLTDEMIINIPWSGLGKLSTAEISSSNTSAINTISTSTSPGVVTNKVSLNSGTKSDLMSLKGIGETYALKIIDGRPITSYLDLHDRIKLPQNLVESLKSTTEL